MQFQNSTGMSVTNFMVMLEFYLNSIFILYEGKHYLQRHGICIGSCVAPILCNIFLSSLDRTFNDSLDRNVVFTVFRCVDDCLIVLKRLTLVTYLTMVENVLELFNRHGRCLAFTHELPVNTELQFLDITIRFSQDHVCWWYQPHAKQELLPFESAHSKTLKRAIASLTLESALQKSCVRKMQESFNNQIRRLHSAGFPGTIVVAVAKTLLKKVYGVKKPKDNRGSEKTDVVLYLHRVSHNMKKVAKRYGISIVFSAPCKLARLCSRIPGERKKEGCGKKHSNRYVECAVSVVYEILLPCERSCIARWPVALAVEPGNMSCLSGMLRPCIFSLSFNHD